MDSFPKKAKVFKLMDRVICVNEKRDNMFLVKGAVRYIGQLVGQKTTTVVVEFDKTVKSKDDVRKYYACKPGFGAFLEPADLYKVGNEKFDEDAFKKSLLNPEENGAKPKSEMVIEMAESFGEFDEGSSGLGGSPPPLLSNRSTKLAPQESHKELKTDPVFDSDKTETKSILISEKEIALETNEEPLPANLDKKVEPAENLKLPNGLESKLSSKILPDNLTNSRAVLEKKSKFERCFGK